MSRQSLVRPVVLLAVAVSVSIAGEAQGQTRGRMAVASRQQIRAMVAAATADGEMTVGERQNILLMGKSLLSRGDFQQLQQHLVQRPLVQRPGRPTSVAPRSTAMSTAIRYNPQPGSITARPTGLVMSSGEMPAGGQVVHSSHAAGPAEQGPAAPEDPTDCSCDYSCDCDSGCCDGCYGDGCRGGYCSSGWDNITLFTTVDGFKGPLDLDGRNGNFGFKFGVNAGFPLWDEAGIGVQVGTAEVLSNFHGTEFTGSTSRAQNFTTVGLFQRHPGFMPGLSWGVGFDWLYDDYYETMRFGQWRLKFAYDWDCRNEFGVWINIPDHGDSVLLGSEEMGYSWNRFRPISEANFYHRRYWETGTNTSWWLGVAESPGNLVFGADAEVPITARLALVGDFNCVLPSSGGTPGQDEEMWNVSVGIAFTPGPCGNGGRPGRFAPLLPVADNGIFGMRRR